MEEAERPETFLRNPPTNFRGDHYGRFPVLGSASPGDHTTSDGDSVVLFSSNELVFRYASIGGVSLLEGGRQRGS